MALADDLVGIKGEVNDILRGVFEFEGARLFLLRHGGETSRFTVVAEITIGWRARFNSFREQMGLRIATNDESFPDKIAISSHFAYGVPIENEESVSEIDVFAIDPDQRDVIPPSDGSYFWRIFGTKVRHERFPVPSDEPPPQEWIVQRVIPISFLSLTIGSPVVVVQGADFTAEDIGRRLVIEDAVDGVIETVNNSEEVVLDSSATAAPFFAEVTIYELA